MKTERRTGGEPVRPLSFVRSRVFDRQAIVPHGRWIDCAGQVPAGTGAP